MRLFEQSRPILKVGRIRDMIQRAQGYYALAGILINIATLYTVREAMIRHYMPWMNFFIILAIIAVGMLITIYIDHKIVYPSQVAYHQHLAWRSKSPVRKELEKLDNIETKLDEVINELREIKGEVPFCDLLKDEQVGRSVYKRL